MMRSAVVVMFAAEAFAVMFAIVKRMVFLIVPLMKSAVLQTLPEMELLIAQALL